MHGLVEASGPTSPWGGRNKAKNGKQAGTTPTWYASEGLLKLGNLAPWLWASLCSTRGVAQNARAPQVKGAADRGRRGRREVTRHSIHSRKNEKKSVSVPESAAGNGSLR